MIAGDYIQTTWSKAPQYVCARCGVSTVGISRGFQRMLEHLEGIHSQAPEPVPVEEPTATPDEEPANAPEDEPDKEPVETEG